MPERRLERFIRWRCDVAPRMENQSHEAADQRIAALEQTLHRIERARIGDH